MEKKSIILERVLVLTGESNIKYSTELTHWVFTLLGIWLNKNNKNIINQILPVVMIFVCYFLILFIVVPCSLDIIMSEKDINSKIKIVGPLVCFFMVICKYSLLLTKKKDIYNCFKYIYDDWRKVQLINDENIMLENAGIGRFITIICAGFMYGSSFFYTTIMPFAVGSFVTPDNETIKPLAYPVYDPLFSAQETPNYQIVFALQWLSGIVICSVTVSACSLAAVFAFHACGQLKIVISRLDNFVDQNHNYDDVLKNKMAVIIELHLRTIRFILLVEDVLNKLIFIEFFGCIFNICMLSYYLIKEYEKAEIISTVTFCALLVSFTFNIFIFCYIGEMLTQQGEEVGWAAYNKNQWYELTTKNSRGLILIAIMSNYPCSLTAGKIVNMSYSSFASVIKSAMTYMNILRTTL